MAAGIALIVALVLCLLLVPLVRRVGRRRGWLAWPREDRWNRQAVPTMGGIAIFTATLGGIFAADLLAGRTGSLPWGLLAGAVVIFAIGVVDDLRALSPQAKLVGEIIAATLAISAGVVTNFFTPRIANPNLAQLFNILLTYLWLVGITNAINLLDNMDGLAAGISLITAGFMSVIFWQTGSQGLLVLSLGLAGSLLGFLVYNFPPATIFMGDSGSLFLGFTLAGLAIARQPQASSVLAVVGVPTLLFLLPILDTTLVLITRLIRGESPIQGGRDHTSHRLIAFGLNERQAVLALYMVAIIAGLAGLAVEALDYWLSLVVVPLLVVSLALVTAYLGGLKVLVSPRSARSPRTVNRLVVELTFRRRFLEVFLDFILITLAYYLAFLVYYRADLDPATQSRFLLTLPLALGSSFIACYLFGIYRGVWRYIGLDDVLGFLKASLGALAILTAAAWLLYNRTVYPLAIFILFAAFLFLGLTGSRSSFKLLDRLSLQQVRQEEQRVLICGAGDAGEIAVRWMMMNPQLAYRPIGFLDSDPFKVGRHIHGVEVLGLPDQIEAIITEQEVHGVVLTAEYFNTHSEESEQVLNAVRARGCWVRTLRLDFELFES